MLLKYTLKSIKRSPLINTLFCFLLLCAGTLSCLGVGLLVSVYNTADTINNSITTIALPDFSTISRYSDNYISIHRLPEFTFPDGSVITTENNRFYEYSISSFIFSEIHNNIANSVYNSDEITMDSRRAFGAYAPDLIPFGYRSPYTYYRSSLYPPATVAFIAECTDIEIWYSRIKEADHGYALREIYETYFDIIETLLYHPSARFFPQRIYAEIHTFNSDGSELFEVGKQYFILGRSFYHPRREDDTARLSFFYFSNNRIDTGRFMTSTDDAGWRDVFPESELPLRIFRNVQGEPDQNALNYLYYYWLDQGYRKIIELSELPPSAEIQAEIDEIVEMGRKSVHSLLVMTTDNIDSIFHFNQHKARIISGRNFTRDEISNGARVCLISEELARENHLRIGDVITLSLYHTRFNDTSIDHWHPMPYSPNLYMAEPMEFVIIGVYRAPQRDSSPYAIYPNTVYIPDSAVSHFPFFADEVFAESIFSDDILSTGRIPLLNTIIIPNGRTEEFRETVNRLLPDYASFFRIYDQGFSHINAALTNMRNGSILILALCLTSWAIVTLIFCLFFISRKGKEAGLLYAMGVSTASRFRWVYIQCIIVIIVSHTGVLAASNALYNVVLEEAWYHAESAAESDNSNDIFGGNIAEEGIRNEVELIRTRYIMTAASLSSGAILAVITGFASIKVSCRKSFLRKAGNQ
jgi:hypothetical protein